MPTDYACHAAAEQAANSLGPVCAVLAPDRNGPEAEAEVMPVMLRNYLGAGRPQPTFRAGIPVVGVAKGAMVLRLCLDGLRAEMDGTLVLWHASLRQRLPEVLSQARGAAREWQVLQELQSDSQEVLTYLARRDRSGQAGARMLGEQVALMEDVLSGALRRLSVPAGSADECASGLAGAVGALFGLRSSPVER